MADDGEWHEFDNTSNLDNAERHLRDIISADEEEKEDELREDDSEKEEEDGTTNARNEGSICSSKDWYAHDTRTNDPVFNELKDFIATKAEAGHVMNASPNDVSAFPNEVSIRKVEPMGLGNCHVN